MTLSLSNTGGQTNPGLTQDPSGTGFAPDTSLGKDDRNPGTRREDAAEMAVAAAFAMQLANARAASAARPDDDTDAVVVAVPVPPPVIFGLADDAGPDPATRRSDIAALTQKLIGQVEATDRIRLGGNGPVTLTVPLNSTALGLTEAKMVVTAKDLTVTFPLHAGADPAMITAALAELAQVLAQRFPTRTIRLRPEDTSRDTADPTEFNPFKEPVGRRK